MNVGLGNLKSSHNRNSGLPPWAVDPAASAGVGGNIEDIFPKIAPKPGVIPSSPFTIPSYMQPTVTAPTAASNVLAQSTNNAVVPNASLTAPTPLPAPSAAGVLNRSVMGTPPTSTPLTNGFPAYNANRDWQFRKWLLNFIGR